MAFIDDIQSRDTALFPVIEFEIPEGDILRVSIKPFTLEGNYYSPLLLSSPSIKESIDLENRKYKISTVTLSLSNVEVSGIRFSDNKIPFNTGVSIYWVSPSCTTLSDCYLAFKGSVRQISHDEKTCSITVEDISQSSLHKDVPLSLLGSDIEVPERYKNKPIPMVYGVVDKSPCIIRSNNLDDETGQGSVTISVDNIPIEGSYVDNPLMIFRDLYWEVFPDAPYSGSGSLSGEEYKEAHQYLMSGSDFLAQGILNTYDDLNLLADGAAQVINRNNIEGITLFRTFGASDYFGDIEGIANMVDGDLSTHGTVSGTVTYGDAELPESPGNDTTLTFRDIVALYAKYPQLQLEDIYSGDVITEYSPVIEIYADNAQGDGEGILRFFTGRRTFTVGDGNTLNIDENNTQDYPFIIRNEYLPDRFSLIWDINQPDSDISFTAKIYNLKVDTILDVDKFFESDFYANVSGRVSL